MEGPGCILSFMRQLANPESEKQQSIKPGSSDKQHEEQLYDPPTPIEPTSSTTGSSYSYLKVGVDPSCIRSISTPEPVLTPASRAQELAAQTRLENAIVRDDKVKLFRVLESGCNPNPDNLLARIILCRHPLKAHHAFTHFHGAQKLNAVTCMNAALYAQILIDYGARLVQSEVESFLFFQQNLEAEFTREKDCFSNFVVPNKPAHIRDPGKLCFQKVAMSYKGTKNPFIKIILKEVHDNVYFSDRERAICEFAALLLPNLLGYSKSAQNDEKKDEAD